MSAPANRREKRIAAEDSGALIARALADGDLLAIGGLFKQGRPMALVREVIRLGRRDLKLVSSPGSGFDVDLLIAAGCVAETFLPAVTLRTACARPSAARWRRAR